jgi:hypothetical protein
MVDNQWASWDSHRSETVERKTKERVLFCSEKEADPTAS